MSNGNYYLDPEHPDLGGYSFEAGPGGWRWHWSEVAGGEMFDDFGPWLSSYLEAIESACGDWAANGSGGSRLAAVLRGLATRERNR